MVLTSVFNDSNGLPVLTTDVTLKHGLHSGIGEPRLMWERPKVQRTVSGERVARRRMMIKEGRRIREEVSMVALGSGLGNP